MNYKMMGRFIGKILMVEGVFMIPALLISLWEREFGAVKAFLWSIAVIFCGFSGACCFMQRNQK